MNELSQILKKEQDDKNKLFLAEKRAKQEIEQREKELKERLEKESGLTESEKDNLLAERDQRIKKIEQEIQEKLQAELKNLKKVDKEKALQYIVEKYVKSS